MKDQIEAYAKEIEAAYHNDPFWGGENGEKKDKHTFSVEYGRKFAKVIHHAWGQKSAHCFVEISTGNILKVGTWTQPQKNGFRGNIQHAKKPLFQNDFYVR